MQVRKIRGLVPFMAAVSVAALIASSCATADAESQARPRQHDPTAAEVRWAEIKRSENIALWNRSVRWNQTVAWNEAVFSNQLKAFYDAIVAQQAAEAARAALAQAVAARPKAPVAAVPKAAPRPSGTSAVGGACGGSRYDYVIPKESGGNPNARNPSGAWGCYQIMPGTWSSSCNDLGSYGSASTSAQAQCADRLSPSAWAASQG